MKFLVFSDLHIHNYKKFDELGSRLLNCLSVLEDVKAIAEDQGINHVLFAGDLFDQQKTVPTEVLNATFMAFEYFFSTSNITFHAISGNHDMFAKNTFETDNDSSIYPLSVAFENFNVLDNKTFHSIESKLKIAGIPYYQHPEHFYKALDRVDADILLIHQTPEHSNPMIPPDCYSKDFSRFKHVFCGHIHKHEVIQKNFTIVGSPLHRDLGDEGQDKGVLIYDSVTNHIERVILDYPKFQRTNEVLENVYAIPVIDIKQQDSEKAESMEFSSDWNENTITYILKQGKSEDYIEAFKELKKKIVW